MDLNFYICLLVIKAKQFSNRTYCKKKKSVYKIQWTNYNNLEDVCYSVKIGDILVGELSELKIL